MRHLLIATALTLALTAPSPSHALTAQQQRMADCNTQAGDMRGQTRKVFLQQCLSAKPPLLNCGGNGVTGKLCGYSCIAANEVCHK